MQCPLEWRISDRLVPYEEAVAEMEARAAAIYAGTAPECVWLLEHPPLFTGGTSAKPADLLNPMKFPVYESSRGGQFTYHGPGQRVAYVMLNLKARAGSGEPDLRQFVKQLEAWIIRTLAQFHIKGEIRDGRVGVWVQDPRRGECKIAAIGIRVRRWVSYHGISVNVDPDLSHFEGIIPCGIRQFGVTSLNELGLTARLEDVDIALKHTFSEVFA